MRSVSRFSRLAVSARRLFAAFALLLCALGALSSTRAATATQSFTLQPGWNSIFIEVTPANQDPAVVFAGLPVDQVWAYFPTRSPVEYVSNPAAGLFNVPGWNVWLPPGSRPDAAMLTDLKGVIGHQAYLIKNVSSSAATFSVTGTASLQGIKWSPDAFTLTGLPVDPATTVRAGDFFANSPAHAGQPRYRLDASGSWMAVADGAALAPGQAYWIFTKGNSDYTSPLEVSFGGGRTLDFGADGASKKLVLRNRSAYATSVTLNNANGLPLSVEQVVGGTGNTWSALGATTTRSVPANSSVTLTLGVRRAALTGDAAGFLRISGGGVALGVPLAASLPKSVAQGGGLPSAASHRAASTAAAASAANPNAGLWVGVATLNAVSEANSSAPSVPTPTAAPLSLRFIIHVDDSGAARLLKEVTLMKQRVPGGVSADTANPPALVLVTDPARLTDFDAPQTRDGSPFANRISSVGFDFTGNEVTLSGSFGSSLSGVVTVDRNLSTNPFKHRYHPDHNGLTAQYVDQASVTPAIPIDQQEVWGVKRALQITFAAPDANNAAPNAGYAERTGTYLETLGGVDSANPGLHKNPITVSGSFTLRRLNTIGQLNPAAQ